MTELAYINGVFCPIAEARVSIEDRGFQFGDSIYEVIPAYDGRSFLAEEHLLRLRQSAAGIELQYDFNAEPLAPIVEEGLRRSGIDDAMIYIQLTRGAAPRTHEFPKGTPPTVVITFKPLPKIPGRQRQEGVKLMTVRDDRWARCHVKATTLLPNVLAKNKALRSGYDDALFVTVDGEARECTSANLFVVTGRQITIPPRNESILRGVTQEFLLDCAGDLGFEAVEQPVYVDGLYGADEVFVTSTIIEVLGVASIDKKLIRDGGVGPVTRRFYEEFRARCRAESPDRKPATVQT
ncbi:MAG: aminotransferase class IV [Phycisphaerales bacterium]|nr:MAG: aminotransferase class IV [Phycisphaerales bacterium]